MKLLTTGLFKSSLMRISSSRTKLMPFESREVPLNLSPAINSKFKFSMKEFTSLNRKNLT